MSMITPQTNTTLDEIARHLLDCDSLCICGHVRPDGDCVGSTLGLAWALRHLGKKVVPLLAQDATIDPALSFLPMSEDAVSACDFLQQLDFDVACDGASDRGENALACDAFICVDVPSEARLGDAAAAIKSRARLSVTLDHHAAPERMSDLSYTDPDATSATMLIWELAKRLGIDAATPGVSELATCIYTGLSTDSGSFMNQNTDERAFACACELVSCGADPSRIAQGLYQARTVASVRIDAVVADNMQLIESREGKLFVISCISLGEMQRLGASEDDSEHAVSLLRSIAGVDIACILKEHDGSVRGSFRAKDDTDVAAIAREFGGGGHRAAAGFTLECSLEDAVRIIKERLLKVG